MVPPPPYWYNNQTGNCPRPLNVEDYAAFWYHPDHLSSSSYITNLDGEISQHMEYLPFGETLVEEHLNSNNSPYKFNAKEFDAETGNYYYGARYYDPKLSVWLSVDPLAEDFAGWTPYHYVHQNPINLIDPTGMSAEGIETHFVNEKGETIANTDDGSNEVIVIRKENEEKFTKELSEKVKTKDDLNPEVNKKLGEKYGYNFKEHYKNVDGGKGENYKADLSDDRQIQWNIGYNKGYNDESMILDMGSYQPGSSSRGMGYSRGESHRKAGKMHASEPKLLNKNSSNYIKTNQAPRVNYRKYSEKPIPLLIDPM